MKSFLSSFLCGFNHIKSCLYLSCLERNLKLVLIWEYTKTSKYILRPAFDQSNCKKAVPALILIERHITTETNYQAENVSSPFLKHDYEFCAVHVPSMLQIFVVQVLL